MIKEENIFWYVNRIHVQAGLENILADQNTLEMEATNVPCAIKARVCSISIRFLELKHVYLFRLVWMYWNKNTKKYQSIASNGKINDSVQSWLRIDIIWMIQQTGNTAHSC